MNIGFTTISFSQKNIQKYTAPAIELPNMKTDLIDQTAISAKISVHGLFTHMKS